MCCYPLGAPIIPIFTENIREAFDTISYGGELWKDIYERTKVTTWPIFGGLPVKLTTHVGDPIIARKDETVNQLKDRVEKTMKYMIDSHQVKSGGVVRAVMERLSTRLSITSISK